LSPGGKREGGSTMVMGSLLWEGSVDGYGIPDF
jgi:hypothetical protein